MLREGRRRRLVVKAMVIHGHSPSQRGCDGSGPLLLLPSRRKVCAVFLAIGLPEV